MRRCLLPPILILLVLLTALPSAAQTPAASPGDGPGGWRVEQPRTLDIETRYPVLSPDGLMLAGATGDGVLCVWVVETLAASCVDEQLPIREETITWSPDGTAVAFALNAAVYLYESDIYVYEVQQGQLLNLTDDGHEGGLLDFTDVDPPVDDVPAWSPDSQQVAFARSHFGDEEPGSTTIMRIGRTGGEPVEVVSIDADLPMTVWTPMRWLPDGTLVYSRLSPTPDDTRNGIWAAPIDGGDPVQLAPGGEGTDIPGAVIVDVDPQRGQAIVFAWLLAGQRGAAGDQPLFWIIDIASGERQPFPDLTGDGDRPPVVLDAGYAPDGTTILLVTLTESGLELMTMDPVSGAVTPVSGEPIDAALLPDASLRWASDGAAVLHASGGSLLLRLEPTGDAAAATPAPATPVASPAAANPVPSSTGWRIADERQLDLGSDPGYVAMTPDGQWLAGLGPQGTVCIWDVATLAPACVEEVLPVREETLTWAPDGSAVAFALNLRGLQESDIYVLERESGTLTNLTDDGVAGDLLSEELADENPPLDDVPVWSPDSQRIAFVRSFAGAEGSSTSIMWIDRAGGEPVEVLPLDVDEAQAIFMPMHWLADGTLLYSQMVLDLADPHNGVWTVGVDDGASPLQLVPGSEETDVPGPWVSDTADGRAITYSYWLMSQSAFGEEPLFWVVDIATGEQTPLQVPPGIAPGPVRIVDATFAPDGATAMLSTMSPGGARLMVLDVATGEVSALDTEPRDRLFSAGTPQWSTNDTVLLQTADGPLLLTLEPAA